jgi:arsenite methyltransferase
VTTPSLVDQGQTKYAAVSQSALSSADAGVRALAEAFGYSPEGLAAIPAEADLGRSCGNKEDLLQAE